MQNGLQVGSKEIEAALIRAIKTPERQKDQWPPRSAELDAVERLSRVKETKQDHQQAQAYWQRVAEIGRQETQTTKMTEKQTAASEHTQKRVPRQTQT